MFGVRVQLSEGLVKKDLAEKTTHIMRVINPKGNAMSKEIETAAVAAEAASTAAEAVIASNPNTKVILVAGVVAAVGAGTVYAVKRYRNRKNADVIALVPES